MRTSFRRLLLIGGACLGLCVLAALPTIATAESGIAVTGVTQTDFQLCPNGPPGSFDAGFGPPPAGCRSGGRTGEPSSPVTFCPDADVHVWMHANISDAEPKVTPDPTGAGIEDGTLQVTVTGADTHVVEQVFVPYTRPDPSAPTAMFDIGTLVPGTYTVTADWLGSQFDFIANGATATLTELPSEATDTLTILPACLGKSAFVVGDGNAGPGASVTFWGAQWAKKNVLSQGPGASSFKGWTNTVNAGQSVCGGTWASTTGNSSQPPAAIAPYITVIVTGQAVQHGSTISGTIEHVLIVRTDPGYGPSPGKAGTGEVVGQLC